MQYPAAATAPWLHSPLVRAASNITVCRHGVRRGLTRHEALDMPLGVILQRSVGRLEPARWRLEPPLQRAEHGARDAQRRREEDPHRRVEAVRLVVETCGATVRTSLGRAVRHHRAPGPYGTTKLPCAFGTYGTQEAGTRSPYVQYGGPGACVSAQTEA